MLPTQSPEARAAALEKAAEARRARAVVRHRLKFGGAAIADVLRQGETDDAIGRMRVSALLESMPGIGRVRARDLMASLGIAESRRVRGLGHQQVQALIAHFGGHALQAAPIVVVAGPSGVGKGTVIAWAREHLPTAWLSVSATTRAPRPGETEGVDYHFLSAEEFDAMVREGAFLEWAEYAGNRYGTPLQPLLEHAAAGQPVLLEIELEGARQVRRRLPQATLVFIAPPTWEELVRRLNGRGTEAPEHVDRRLATARHEMAAAPEFDVTILNDDVERAGAALVDLLESASTK